VDRDPAADALVAAILADVRRAYVAHVCYWLRVVLATREGTPDG
jgi:hypothetical protein